MANDTPTAQVIPFPRQLRVVPVKADRPAAVPKPPTLVDYDGRVYRLEQILFSLAHTLRR